MTTLANRNHLLPRALLAVCLACGLGAPVVLRAQGAGGTIVGTVKDATGAVIPGASVSLKNVATGVETVVATNASGFYAAPNLLPGTYEGEATAQGFSEAVARKVSLTVGAQQIVDFVIQVGGLEQSLEVRAGASVELASSALSGLVDSTRVVELPLNGRDWTSLATLEPGVANVRTQSALAISNQRANRGLGSQLTISGNRPQQNNYRLDGISINDYSNGGPGSVLGVVLGVDAVQEFSVVTSNAPANYGKSSGGNPQRNHSFRRECISRRRV